MTIGVGNWHSARSGLTPVWELGSPLIARATSADDDALLRRHGLRITAQRLAVLRAMADRPHSTADDIYSDVRAEIGAISRQAVYDALAVLTDKGLIRRIQPAGSPARDSGYEVDEAEVIYWGRCPECVALDRKQ
jgi:Fur family ferric uptake transcriptional regulator